MFFNVLARWLRMLLTIAVLVGGILLIKEWLDHLPRDFRSTDSDTGLTTVQPLRTIGERLAAWTPQHRSTRWLVPGLLLLLWTVAGRFVSPWAWRRGGVAAPRLAPEHAHDLRTANGHALRVEEHGRPDAPPLVLVHGVGSDRTQWAEGIADLANRFRVHVLDLVGHGRSAKGKPVDHTIESATDDLDDLVRRIGPDGLVLVGHSMGGMIAMRWCWTHPEQASRIAGLVLVHTTPQNPFTTMKPMWLHRSLMGVYGALLGITPVLAPLLRVEQWLEYLNGTVHWQNAASLFGGSESREQLDRSARLFARHDPAVGARFTRSMMHFEARPKLPALDVPTVVVAAAKDGTTSPEASRTIADKIPGAHLVMLRDTRHMGFVERRREFAESIARLELRNHEGMRRAQP